MYHDLKRKYWWYGMKRVVAEYVALCDNYQRDLQTFATTEDTSIKVGRNKYGFHF
jgi:hypothetical protein